MNTSFLVTISLFCWLFFLLFFNYDRCRYRNCLLLFIALCSTVPALCSLAGENAPRVLYFCIILFCIALLIVPVFLIHNGILMMKREGRSLANMLSLLLGLVIGFGEVSTFLFLLWVENSGGSGRLVSTLEHTALINYLISGTVIYGSVSFLIFMLYSVFLMIIPRKSDFDYIIIHGAGLLGGDRVSKLLQDRIDKAIDVYLKDPTPTIMIPSGGKGGDETISEAVTALRGGSVRALAVNENYLDLLSESEDFGSLSEELRLIETLEVPLGVSSGSEEDSSSSGAGTSSSAGALFGSRLPSKPARSEQPSAAEKVEKDKCIVLYLSGNDARTSALTTGRSDVNILMLINPATDQILLLNTPRDYYVPNPALGGGMDKLTHCGLFGTYNSMAALEGLYDVEIDNYCQINFSGFIKLVDALGGITLDNPRAFYSSSGYFFPEGEITLDGEHALSYGRERDAFGDGDLARGRNLMRLITAMIDKAKSSGTSLLTSYPAVLESLGDMFATDLSSDEISALVKLAIRDLSEWEVLSTSVSGDGGIMRTASGGEVPLYVMRPDVAQVERTSALLDRFLAGERIEQDDLG